MKAVFADFKTSLLLTAAFTVVLCGIYPLAVWVGAQAFFAGKANGSLVVDKTGAVRGSSLLAQNFSDAKYFQPRPSGAGSGYDPMNSGGTNLGPTSAKLANGVHGKDANDPNNFDGISDLAAAYRSANGLPAGTPVPADAVTRSGSGLDPDISPANARIQEARVAAARHTSVDAVNAIVAAHTQGRDLGIFGKPRVNVLELNLALDREIP